MQLLDAEVAGIAAAVDPVFAVIVIPDVLEKVFSVFAACLGLGWPCSIPGEAARFAYPTSGPA